MEGSGRRDCFKSLRCLLDIQVKVSVAVGNVNPEFGAFSKSELW